MLLDGRVAVITGGSRGLGAQIAAVFCQEGCRVVCAGRSDEPSDESTGHERMIHHKVDVRDAQSVRELMAKARDHFGRLDVLVANAAVSLPGFVETAAAAAWADTVDTNLTGTFHCVQAAIPYLADAGGGRIITLSSALATRIAPGSSAYSATKAAIEAFTRIAAVELAPRSITVNCLAPGFIDAGMGRQLSADTTVWPQYERRLAMGRMGGADEVARAAVFLAGPDSSYVNGHVLEVNGGLNW
ncbi:3-oxoacyl-ACP reductase [Actinosynnema sp. ALI-1.44]|uniref:SDR family NAD(P)-dependent oxidoreductase n=1 Tax=Actinosynnema sp. ALI-1.44 TaxID=1933779 RepID=UPI00097C66C9|nr:SDR family NAD(P)-dependent oxidoreductase [Actinosynnema sp. ALI-1.44]ONI76400.1 3-oxoacyl-ACP reductase [Actinosynnema sp. ALI-1.44]